MLSSNTSAVSGDANYIEDVFSTYLITGNASTQNVVNNIDLSTKGGMVWTKSRNEANAGYLYNTITGANNWLVPSTTAAAATGVGRLTGFNTNGFTLGSNENSNYSTTVTGATWTFREQPKFFDVVTYTGNGTYYTPISHNLGSVPGCIIVKRTDSIDNWAVYHRSLSGNGYLRLNTTEAERSDSNVFPSGGVNASTFNVGADAQVNASGATYVAYLFAHDAGGFGLTGTDNVISCGSYSGTGAAGNSVTLGYEPQWILLKETTTAGVGWYLHDVMRGMPTGGNSLSLQPNTSAAEAGAAPYIDVTSTGFQLTTGINGYNGAGRSYIYIAIRRGPMKVPTDATKVFTPIKTGSGSALSDSYASVGFPTDMTLRYQTGTDVAPAYKNAVFTRLLGINSGAADGPSSINIRKLLTHSSDAETSSGAFFSQTGSMGLNYGGSWNAPSYVMSHMHFRRAPGFFDVICYTGDGSVRTLNHNLQAVPELMITRSRSGTDWWTYAAPLAATEYLTLDTTNAKGTTTTAWNSTRPTSSVLTLGTAPGVNNAAENYVAYLFATCAGVSKVGSYTGTGTTKQVDCGFAAGARFVLIKRTDSTGDWYVWDTARGIVSGNDPYLLLNSTAAEVTITDYIDTYSAGFELSTTAAATVNVIGGSYIFLAIA